MPNEKLPPERVSIRWYAVANKRPGGGWLPAYDVNGRPHGHRYWPTGYDADEALRLAEAGAREEAARYVGDWNVDVAAAAPGGRR